MKILIDVFGCDNPDSVIVGLANAINQLPQVELIACGDASLIAERLSGIEFDRSRLEILDAPEIITNHEKPVYAVRTKKRSSLVVAYNALKGRDDIPIMISAGNTGAVIAGAVLLLGRDDREDRPTLITCLPNDKGGFTCLADCGANVDCRPEHYVQFARYANSYVKSVYGIENPKIALLSVGTEDEKGNGVTKEAFALLKQSELNFVGNMEAKSALTGDYDVIVADGFHGNVLLKTIEGTAKSLIRRTIDLIKKHADKDTDLTFVKRAFGELNGVIDFNSLGGAILLGAKKPIIKAHGSANSDTVVNTVKQALAILNSNLIKNKGE